MVKETPVRSSLNPWMSVASAWKRASEHMSRSVVEANRAAVAAFGLSTEEATDEDLEPLVPAMAYRRANWTFDHVAETPEDVGVGDRVSFTKRITDADVHAFARISGDTNRLHLDDEFADQTRFQGRIAHGTLVSGLISAALARLPGLTIYLSQDLQFLRPVQIGETITATCEIVENLGDHKYRLTTKVLGADDETIVDGEAIVLIDPLPESKD